MMRAGTDYGARIMVDYCKKLLRPGTARAARADKLKPLPKTPRRNDKKPV